MTDGSREPQGERARGPRTPGQVRHPRPPEEGGSNRGERYPEESPDVSEAVAWCDRCETESRHVYRDVDVSDEEAASDMPDVRQALEGEQGWVCQTCGNFRRDLVADKAYDDWEYSNIGYTVPDDEEDAQTIRSSGEEGVTPPERIKAEVETKRPDDTGETAEWEVPDED